MIRNTIYAALFGATSAITGDNTKDYQNCLSSNLSWCLNPDNFSEGICCDPTLAEADKSDDCKSITSHCVLNTMNSQVKDFMRPANAEKCPTAKSDSVVSLNEIGKFEYRMKLWEQTLPDASADWNCKYMIEAAQVHQGQYIFLELENYGFEEQIRVMVQPNEIQDYDPNVKKQPTMIYDAGFGSTFVVAGENRVFISFEPTANAPARANIESKSGKFRIRTKIDDTPVADLYS